MHSFAVAQERGGGGAKREERKKKWGEGGEGRPSFIYVSMVIVVDDGIWFINGRHSQRRPLAIF